VEGSEVLARESEKLDGGLDGARLNTS